MASVIEKVQSGFKSLSEGKLGDALTMATNLADSVNATWLQNPGAQSVAGQLKTLADSAKTHVTSGPTFIVKAPSQADLTAMRKPIPEIPYSKPDSRFRNGDALTLWNELEGIRTDVNAKKSNTSLTPADIQEIQSKESLYNQKLALYRQFYTKMGYNLGLADLNDRKKKAEKAAAQIETTVIGTDIRNNAGFSLPAIKEARNTFLHQFQTLDQGSSPEQFSRVGQEYSDVLEANRNSITSKSRLNSFRGKSAADRADMDAKLDEQKKQAAAELAAKEIEKSVIGSLSRLAAGFNADPVKDARAKFISDYTANPVRRGDVWNKYRSILVANKSSITSASFLNRMRGISREQRKEMIADSRKERERFSGIKRISKPLPFFKESRKAYEEIIEPAYSAIVEAEKLEEIRTAKEDYAKAVDAYNTRVASIGAELRAFKEGVEGISFEPRPWFSTDAKLIYEDFDIEGLYNAIGEAFIATGNKENDAYKAAVDAYTNAVAEYKREYNPGEPSAVERDNTKRLQKAKELVRKEGSITINPSSTEKKEYDTVIAAREKARKYGATDDDFLDFLKKYDDYETTVRNILINNTAAAASAPTGRVETNANSTSAPVGNAGGASGSSAAPRGRATFSVIPRSPADTPSIEEQRRAAVAFRSNTSNPNSGVEMTSFSRSNTTRRNNATRSADNETTAERNARLNAEIKERLAARKANNQNAAAVKRIVALATQGVRSNLNRTLNAPSNAAAQPASAISVVPTRPLSLTPSVEPLKKNALNALTEARIKSATGSPAEAPAPSPSNSTAASVGNLFAPGFGNATTPAPQNPKVSDKRLSYSGEQAKRNAAANVATRDRDNAEQNTEYKRLVKLKKTNNWNDGQFKITKFIGSDGRVVLQKTGSMATMVGGARQTRRRNQKKRRATRKG